jgi:hypothetical protein
VFAAWTKPLFRDGDQFAVFQAAMDQPQKHAEIVKTGLFPSPNNHRTIIEGSSNEGGKPVIDALPVWHVLV